MNSESEKSLLIELGLIALLAILLVATAISGRVGKSYGRNEMMKQAVEQGAAKWVVDKDGVVQFQWIKDKAGAE